MSCNIFCYEQNVWKSLTNLIAGCLKSQWTNQPVHGSLISNT